MTQAVFFKSLYTLTLVACLSACSRHEQVPAQREPKASPVAGVAASVPPMAPSASSAADNAKRLALMQAIFERGYSAKADNTLAVVEGVQYLMTMVDTTVLPDGRTVVVVNGSPSDEDGNDLSSHAAAGTLNVYTLRRADANSEWKVIERYENVDRLGSNGQIGSVKWVSLGADKPGFIVSWGGIWQGNWISFASIYDLNAGVRNVGTFKEGSSNEGACVPESGECWDVEGSIVFVPNPEAGAYQDIQVNFDDQRYTVTEDNTGPMTKHIKTSAKTAARYRFDGKEYVLVSGVNPVPDI